MREFKSWRTPQVAISTHPKKEFPIRVSIVIPNWNGAHLLGPCLDSLNKMTYQDFEIIVVDDGSTDNSLKLLHEKYPDVRCVKLASNHGFARAVNEGIKQAQGKFIALLNNDIEVEPDWLERLVGGLTAHPEHDIAASLMLYHDLRDVIYNAGDRFHPWGAGGARGEGETNLGQYDHEQEVFGACAGAALYRKEVFDRIGLFDETFESLAEDVDLNARARLAGMSTVFVPSAVVYHHGSATLGRYSDRYIRLVTRNEWFVMIKNLPFGLFMKYFGHILKHHLNTSAYFSYRGQGAQLLKARWAVIWHLGRLLLARAGIQRNRALPDAELEQWFPQEAVKFDAQSPVKTEKPVPGLTAS